MNYTKLSTIYHPYVPAMVNFLERWLSQKASDGWRLVELHGWKFIFRKCEPYSARFFSYSGFGTSNGISNEYWASKYRYSCSKSTISKLNSAIYEVDIRKIDSGFNHLVLLRNKFYLKHYFALLLFALVYTAFAIRLMLINSILTFFLVFGIILLMYSLFSVFILTREVKQHSTF